MTDVSGQLTRCGGGCWLCDCGGWELGGWGRGDHNGVGGRGRRHVGRGGGGAIWPARGKRAGATQRLLLVQNKALDTYTVTWLDLAGVMERLAQATRSILNGFSCKETSAVTFITLEGIVYKCAHAAMIQQFNIGSGHSSSAVIHYIQYNKQVCNVKSPTCSTL